MRVKASLNYHRIVKMRDIIVQLLLKLGQQLLLIEMGWSSWMIRNMFINVYDSAQEL
ncbi:uncharacterized protein G2W53_016798 [Senna tora]|uniref:Uncharacterized protein n=1 Tax=Senna tora TaxID=362788 RepID=A0A834WQI3_9FABA|nr:uncharacterized protein G2W53_016798 [Senna tora]